MLIKNYFIQTLKQKYKITEDINMLLEEFIETITEEIGEDVIMSSIDSSKGQYKAITTLVDDIFTYMVLERKDVIYVRFFNVKE